MGHHRRAGEWCRLLVVFAASLVLGACSDHPPGDPHPDLTAALEGNWASVLAANKIGQVAFNGSRLRVEYGVSASLESAVNLRDIPNYTDQPVPFTVLVHHTPAGPELEVYAAFEQPPYRLRRVRRDIDELLHQAMTAFLRERQILEAR